MLDHGLSIPKLSSGGLDYGFVRELLRQPALSRRLYTGDREEDEDFWTMAQEFQTSLKGDLIDTGHS